MVTELGGARVIHQGINSSPAIKRCLGEFSAVFILRYVRLQHFRLNAKRLTGSPCDLGTVRIAGEVDHYMSAFFRQLSGTGRPHP